MPWTDSLRHPQWMRATTEKATSPVPWDHFLLPPAHCLPLYYQGYVVGLVTPSWTERLRLMAPKGIKITPEAITFDGQWEALYETLLSHRVLVGPNHESLPLIDRTGKVLSVAPRGLFRALGLTTQCVYAWVRNEQGQWLLSQRALTKIIDPGLWDCAGAGLIQRHESVETALYRELEEEAGLQTTEVTNLVGYPPMITTRMIAEGILQEIAYCYTLTMQPHGCPRNHDGEVRQFTWVSTTQLTQYIHKNLVPAQTAWVYHNCLEKTL